MEEENHVIPIDVFILILYFGEYLGVNAPFDNLIQDSVPDLILFTCFDFFFLVQTVCFEVCLLPPVSVFNVLEGDYSVAIKKKHWIVLRIFDMNPQKTLMHAGKCAPFT